MGDKNEGDIAGWFRDFSADAKAKGSVPQDGGTEPASLVESTDVGKEPLARARREHYEAFHKGEKQRIEDDTAWRQFFFRFVMIANISLISCSVLLVAYLVIRGGAPTPVLVAFLSGVVIEVIGLSAILANYFFPRAGSNGMSDIPPGSEGRQGEDRRA